MEKILIFCFMYVAAKLPDEIRLPTAEWFGDGELEDRRSAEGRHTEFAGQFFLFFFLYFSHSVGSEYAI